MAHSQGLLLLVLRLLLAGILYKFLRIIIQYVWDELKYIRKNPESRNGVKIVSKKEEFKRRSNQTERRKSNETES